MITEDQKVAKSLSNDTVRVLRKMTEGYELHEVMRLRGTDYEYCCYLQDKNDDVLCVPECHTNILSHHKLIWLLPDVPMTEYRLTKKGRSVVQILLETGRIWQTGVQLV